MNKDIDQQSQPTGKNVSKEDTAPTSVSSPVSASASPVYQHVAEVVVTDMGDELVLVHAALGKVFSLNSSGRLLWLGLPATVGALAKVLVDTFDVDAKEAQADSLEWLTTLEKVGLVEKRVAQN